MSKKIVKEDIEDNESIGKVLNSYLESLIWSSGEEYDGKTIFDFDSKTKERLKDEILKFIELISVNKAAIAEMDTYSEEDFGHNFALASGGHGAGFFDDNNDILQDLASSFNAPELYVGDDGKLYVLGAENYIKESKEIKEPIRIKLSELKFLIKRIVKESQENETDQLILGYDEEQANKYVRNDDDFESGEDFIDEANQYDNDTEFTPHGSYTLGNSGGYLIMLSNDSEAAKVKDSFGSDNPVVSDWLPVETDENDESFIDKWVDDGEEHYDIPMSEVMRIN